MSKRTSSGKAKDKGLAGDGPAGRPPNRPGYQPGDRPISLIVATPKCASLGRGGRGGGSSASGNGDQFADDRENIREYLDEGIRPSSRLAGRGDSSSAEITGSTLRRAFKKGRKNRLTLVDRQVLKHTTGSIWIHQHRLRLEKERGGPNVVEKHSDLMEEMYGEDNSCYPRVGDREIWERVCGGPARKRRFFGFGSPMDIDLALTCTSSTPSTGGPLAHHACIASSYEVENLKDQLDKQGKVAQERERVAKEPQQAAEERERERAAEQRVKKKTKDIVKMLKTLKPPPSPCLKL
uniref:Uncharacterized protein n=1 Tax=Tanacetum cinerariifolium TaxID=118510 RepID=A0A6L2MK17_TANCI|nr:hypothetical protein [Tanacetum cinerariifolium]